MTLLQVLDLLGVFVFAVSGAALAVEKRLDLFGVVVLSVVTALGGGLLRDVLLGDTPPVALHESRYLVVALLAGVLVFLGSTRVHLVARVVTVFDAAGLGLFVATGTAKALHAGLGAAPAIALGCPPASAAAWSGTSLWPRSRWSCGASSTPYPRSSGPSS
ncbi:MAG: hypothetical protein JWO22_3074 [Frankiales bacterium]|nr:hypothetical protein [Frankiales bacterium]